MLFSIESAALRRALEALSKVVDKRNTIPILSYIRVQAGPDGVALLGNNLDMMLSLDLPATVETAGAYCLPLARLLEIVKRADKGAAVTIEAAGETAKVTAGRAVATLGTLPAFDFPQIAPKPARAAVTLPLAQLVGDFARLAVAVSTEETRYYLNGVFIRRRPGNGGALDMVATDGHKLIWIARPDCPLPETWGGVGHSEGAILQRMALPVLAAVAGKKPAGDVTMTLSEGGAVFTFEAPGWRLISKAVDGTFPDFTRVVPAYVYDPVTVDGESLAAVVGRVAPGRGSKARAVTLTMRAGRIEASSKDDDGGACEELPADYAGNGQALPRVAGFNAAYIAGVAALGGGRVTFGAQVADAPCLFTYPEAPELLAVLMPLRIGETCGGVNAERIADRPAAFQPTAAEKAAQEQEARAAKIRDHWDSYAYARERAAGTSNDERRTRYRAEALGHIAALRELMGRPRKSAAAIGQNPPAQEQESPPAVIMPADASEGASGPEIAPAVAMEREACDMRDPPLGGGGCYQIDRGGDCTRILFKPHAWASHGQGLEIVADTQPGRSDAEIDSIIAAHDAGRNPSPADPVDVPAPIPANAPPAPVPVPAGYPIPHAPAHDAAPDLAAVVAALAAQVAAMQARLNAIGGDAPAALPADAEAAARLKQLDSDNAALVAEMVRLQMDNTRLAADLAAARRDAADWQRAFEIERGTARYHDDARRQLRDAMLAKRQRTAARLRAARNMAKAARADAAAWEAMAGEAESRLAPALASLAAAESAKADLSAAVARMRATAPLAGIRYGTIDQGLRRWASAA